MPFSHWQNVQRHLLAELDVVIFTWSWLELAKKVDGMMIYW